MNNVDIKMTANDHTPLFVDKEELYDLLHSALDAQSDEHKIRISDSLSMASISLEIQPLLTDRNILPENDEAMNGIMNGIASKVKDKDDDMPVNELVEYFIAELCEQGFITLPRSGDENLESSDSECIDFVHRN
jgi:hypothetical protein